ncbi:hypothetical protein AGMMS49587_20400 [Spirochaetia bacterium]|nr:hypothetical protein AGMMS49587_20400 [Spirochaetia bacterium]
MNRPSTFYTIRPIYRAAAKVFAELGPAKKKEWRHRYLGALAAQFPGGQYGMEREVPLPGLLHPADFTFIYRHILVRVAIYPWSIKPSDSLRADMWRRLDATGIPLGVILNFGREEYEHLRVVHYANLAAWNEERMARRESTVREAVS